MWSRLLPSDVLVEWADSAAGAQPLLEAEAAFVTRAVETRRLEFAKGRECARAALARLEIRNFAVLVGPSREPIWPDQVVGSITHTVGHCAAAVARAAAYLGLGIDAEPALALSAELTSRICTRSERQRLSSFEGVAPELASRLIFSAKEAVYKCQFASTRTFLDFDDVAISLHPAGSFEVEFPTERVPSLDDRQIHGRWLHVSGLLLSAAWIQAR